MGTLRFEVSEGMKRVMNRLMRVIVLGFLGFISHAHATIHLVPDRVASILIPFPDVANLFYWNEQPAVFSPKTGKIAVLDLKHHVFHLKPVIALSAKELAAVVDVSEFGENLVMLTPTVFWVLDFQGRIVKKIEGAVDAGFRRVRCYVSDCFVLSAKQNRIFRYRKAEAHLEDVSAWYQHSINAPFDLAVVPGKDIVFLSNLFSSSVLRISPTEPLHKLVGDWGVWEASFSFPKGMEWDDRQKRLWVADSFLHVVQAFNVRGEFLGVLASPTGIKYFTHPFLVKLHRNQMVILDLFPPVLHVYDQRRVKRLDKRESFDQKYGIRFNFLLDRALHEQPELTREDAVLNLVSFYKKAVCIQCHDTSLRDSRFIWEATHHPFDIRDKETGEIPVTVPKELLVTRDGLGCGTCHVPHHMEVIDPQEGAEVGAPETTRQIRPQEDQTADIFLRFSKATLCLKCHEDQLKTTRSHLNLSDKKQGEQCFECHHPHRSSSKFLTLKNIEQSELCISCHDKAHKQGHPIRGLDRSDETYPHCSSCHHIHNNHEKLLTRADGTSGTTCVDCHEAMKSVTQSVHHFKNVPQGSACLGCHDVHEAARDTYDLTSVTVRADRKTLMQSRQVLFQSSKAFCVSCHGANRLDHHEVIGVSDQLKLKDTDYYLYLFSQSGEKIEPNQAGYITCRTCHDVHNPCESQECQNDPSSGKFLRSPTAVVTFCSACHGEESLIKFRYFHRKQSREKMMR